MSAARKSYSTPDEPKTKINKNGSVYKIRDILNSQDKILTFQPHQHLFFEEDIISGCYEILGGVAMIYRLLPDGRRHILSFEGAGDMLGFPLASDHCEENAEALTPLAVTFKPASHLDMTLSEDAEFRRRVVKWLQRRISRSDKFAVMLGRKTAMERSASFLLEMESLLVRDDGGFVLIPMRRCDIADHLGLTLETISRKFNALHRQGVIDLPQHDRFRVLDQVALHRLAGETDSSVV